MRQLNIKFCIICLRKIERRRKTLTVLLSIIYFNTIRNTIRNLAIAEKIQFVRVKGRVDRQARRTLVL